MNTKSLLIAALATAWVGAASATSKTPADLQQQAQLRAAPTTTRAQVHAEVVAAMARGARLSQGDINRNSPSVHEARAQTTAASRDAAVGK